MNNSNVANTNTIKENPKMKKYIVEVEEPKDGQVVSTGGVRKNGKMESQFKNPVLYEEPKPSPTLVVKKTDIVPVAKVPSCTMKDRLKNEAKGLVVDVGWDLASMLWCDFGKPFLKVKLNQAVERLLLSPQKSSQVHFHDAYVDSDTITINVEAEDLTSPVNDSSDKIIRFPKKRVG